MFPGPAGAAHRSAAMAGGVRPVPFRTRKLSPRAPRVLRSRPWEGRAPLTGGRHRAVRLTLKGFWLSKSLFLYVKLPIIVFYIVQ